MVDAEQILHNLLDKIASEQNYENPEIKLNKLPNEGANFTTFLFKATISTKGKDDLNLFAKVSAVGPALRAQTLIKVFEIEGHFYEKLLAKYKKLEEDHNVEEKDRLNTPKFYGIHPTMYEETIVLEDLSSKGFKTLDRFEILSWEYISTAARELAKLHALSFAYSQYDPEGFAEDITVLKFDFSTSMEVMLKMFEDVGQRALAVTNEENRPKFEKFVSEQAFIKTLEKYFMPGRNEVLKHGDYRASNLMHKYNEDGSITVIPVDYQTVTTGDPLTDLFYLIFTGTDKQFRAAHWNQLLEYYYEQLSEAMKRLGLKPEEIYSKENYNESVKEMLPFGLFVAQTVLPIVTVEDAPQVGNDVDMTTLMNMKQSDVYKERLNGILSDYIEWGIL